MNKIKADKIIHSKRRTVAIEIDEKARIILRCPNGIKKDEIESVILKHEKWIQAKRKLIKERIEKYSFNEFEHGKQILFLGNRYTVDVQNSKEVEVSQDKILVPSNLDVSVKDSLIVFYRKKAQEIIINRTECLAKLLGIRYKSARISNARTRWGSCSSKKTLNFTWRLILAPEKVIDYVIVHELMHTKQMNHSKEFWKLVQNEIPDFKSHEKWLKDNKWIMSI